MNFDQGRKQIFLNSLANNPLSFIDQDTLASAETVVSSFANQAAINAAEIMIISGFARIDKKKIRNIFGSRSIAGAVDKQILRMEHAAGSAAYPAGTAIKVKIKLQSLLNEPEFSRANPVGDIDRIYSFTLDTATVALQSKEFVKKLAKAILEEEEYNESLKGITFDLGTYDETTFAYVTLGKPTKANLSTFTTANAIMITGLSNTQFVKIFATASTTGGLLTVINTYAGTDAATANTLVTKAYEGKNTYEQLRKERIETDNRVFPYSNQLSDMPLPGTSYTCFTFDMDIPRPDLFGAEASNSKAGDQRVKIVLYINEALTVTVGSVTDYVADIIGTWASTAAALESEAYEGVIVAGSLVTSSTAWATANIQIS